MKTNSGILGGAGENILEREDPGSVKEMESAM